MKPEEIKQIIDRWGISQAWLARQMGVSRVTVNRWIKKTAPMTEENEQKAKRLLKHLKEVA